MITITLNPALDKTIKIGALNYGEVNRVGTFREDLGGKGINVGRILTGFAVDTMNFAVLGKENRHEVLEYFRNDNMKVKYIVADGHTRTNIKIVELDKDRTTDINEEGVLISKKLYHDLLEQLDEVAVDSDYIIMGGSLAKGIETSVYGDIARKYKDVAKVVIDADGEILMEGLKGSPYLIKPNIHELEAALNTKLETDKEIAEAALKIINRYKVTYVLVSMGAKGSLLVSKDEAYRCGTIKTDIVSTVGAGDAMLAGFIYGLKVNKPLDECMKFATACSTLTISEEGYPKLSLTKVTELAVLAKVEKNR